MANGSGDGDFEESSEDDESEDDVEMDDAALARLRDLESILFEQNRSIFVTRHGGACSASLEPYDANGDGGAANAHSSEVEDPALQSNDDTNAVFLRLCGASSEFFDEYLDIVNRCRLKRRLSDARAVISRTYGNGAQAFLARSFPLPARAWASWIRSVADEAKVSRAEQTYLGSVVEVQRVTTMAVRDWPRSVTLWSAVASVTTELYETGSAANAFSGGERVSFEEACRALLEECVQGCGEHPMHGGAIWDKRLQLERIALDASAAAGGGVAPSVTHTSNSGATELHNGDAAVEPDAEKRRADATERYRSLIRRRLALPLASNASFVNEPHVQQFAGPDVVAQHAKLFSDDARLQIIMAHEKTIDAAAGKRVKTADASHTDNNATCSGHEPAPPALLKAFVTYISAEQGAHPGHSRKQQQTSKSSPASVHFLYERALEIFPTTSQLWCLLAEYLNTSLRILSVVRDVHVRAMRCCCNGVMKRTEAGLVATATVPTTVQTMDAVTVTSRLFCARVLHLESCGETIEETYAVVQDGLGRLHDLVVMGAGEGGHDTSSAPAAEAKEALSKTESQKCLDATAESYLDLLLVGLSLLRRAALAATDADTSTRISSILRALFLFGDEQLRYLFSSFIDGPGGNSYLVSFIRFWATCEVVIIGDENAARAIFEGLVASKEAKGDFRVWSEYLHFERYIARRPRHVRALYTKCHRLQMHDIMVGDLRRNSELGAPVVVNILDIPDALSAVAARSATGAHASSGGESARSSTGILMDGIHLSQRLCRSWLQFEREEGSVDEYAQADQKVRTRLKEIDALLLAKKERASAKKRGREQQQQQLAARKHATDDGNDDAPKGGLRVPKRVRVDDNKGSGDAGEEVIASMEAGVPGGVVAPVATASAADESPEQQHQRVMYDDKYTVFIKHLPPTTQDDELRQHLSSCGVIRDVRVVREKRKGLSTNHASDDTNNEASLVSPCKGFAYVQFEDDAAVRRAEETMNGSTFSGATILVARSKPTRALGRDHHNHASAARRTSSHPQSRSQHRPPRAQHQQSQQQQQQHYRRRQPRIGLPTSSSPPASQPTRPLIPRSIVRRPPPK